MSQNVSLDIVARLGGAHATRLVMRRRTKTCLRVVKEKEEGKKRGNKTREKDKVAIAPNPHKKVLSVAFVGVTGLVGAMQVEPGNCCWPPDLVAATPPALAVNHRAPGATRECLRSKHWVPVGGRDGPLNQGYAFQQPGPTRKHEQGGFALVVQITHGAHNLLNFLSTPSIYCYP